jgi:hypothetical protein
LLERIKGSGPAEGQYQHLSGRDSKTSTIEFGEASAGAYPVRYFFLAITIHWMQISPERQLHSSHGVGWGSTLPAERRAWQSKLLQEFSPMAAGIKVVSSTDLGSRLLNSC